MKPYIVTVAVKVLVAADNTVEAMAVAEHVDLVEVMNDKTVAIDGVLPVTHKHQLAMFCYPPHSYVDGPGGPVLMSELTKELE